VRVATPPTSDANGTVSLPTPANNTTVEVVAMKGNLSDSTTATLLAPQKKEETGDGPLGQRVSAFVHALISGKDVKHPDRTISDWVTQHNPGADKKSDRAGPKDSVKKNGKEKGDDHPDKGHGKDKKDDGEEERNDSPGNGKKNGHGNDR
jgi:hypothetical protein